MVMLKTEKGPFIFYILYWGLKLGAQKKRPTDKRSYNVPRTQHPMDKTFHSTKHPTRQNTLLDKTFHGKTSYGTKQRKRQNVVRDKTSYRIMFAFKPFSLTALNAKTRNKERKCVDVWLL